VASSAVIVLTGFLSVTRPIQSIVMVGAATALIVFLNVFHSYLLLVRFSAISVMSGANASATARSDQEMSGANASATARSDQEMSGANASATARSDQEMRRNVVEV
jgi:hypothetical protein